MDVSQTENINKEKVKKEKKNKIKTLELKNIITKMKNSLEGFSIGFEQAKERIRESEERSIEIIYFSEQKGKSKRKKRNRI